MDKLLTVIYYTSNREDPVFEQKIRNRLLKSAGDLPIISVSHKPIDLGINICVGPHTPNDHNLYRQIQIGCKAATTPFVIAAEADCIYPEDYFKYIPTDGTDHFYRYANIWILYKKFNYFFQKSSSECGMIAGREFFIETIDKMLEGLPEWDESKDVKLKKISLLHKWNTFGDVTGNPIVSFKTNKGLRQFTRTINNTSDIESLPYWGSVKSLKEEFGL